MRRACIVCAADTGSPKAARCPDHALRTRQDGRTRKAVRETLLDRDGHTCAHCGTHDGPLEMDHIVALAEGGTDHPDNLRLLCRTCHGERHRQHPRGA